MLSRLFQDDSPFSLPTGCEATRTESVKRYIKNGKIYTMVWRDKVVIEDPYLVLVKMSAYAIRTNEPYGGNPPKRSFKDYLVKSYPTI